MNNTKRFYNGTTIEGLKEKRAELIEELKNTPETNTRESAINTKHLIHNIAEINAIIYTDNS
jgi:hypothetical protein